MKNEPPRNEAALFLLMAHYALRASRSGSSAHFARRFSRPAARCRSAQCALEASEDALEEISNGIAARVLTHDLRADVFNR